MADNTTNLGLYRRGPMAWQRDADGVAHFDCDLNADRIDAAITSLQDSIASGLPPQIDGGTF